MLAPIIEEDRLVDLVENSGIQFLDKQFTLNLFIGNDKKRFGYGYALKKSAQEPLAPVCCDEDGRMFEPSCPETAVDPDDPRILSVDTRDTLTIYNGVWFPIPFFAENFLNKDGALNCDPSVAGPFNWARCRVVRIKDDENSNVNLYRAVFAFDTAVQDIQSSDYAAPTSDNVKSGTRYALSLSCGSELLRVRQSGIAWGREWAERVYSDAAVKNRSLKISKEALKDNLNDRIAEAHYLNMLALVTELCPPPEIRLIQRGSDSVEGSIGVSLVLDIGNSRSCGILMEDSSNGALKTARLCLRDLNAPENVYEEAFESRVEFSKANFDYDGRSTRSGRSDAFSWPSLVRTGCEAANLSSLRNGNEGMTGKISPKRYLWNERSSGNSKEWQFNPYSYQIPLIDRLSGKLLGYGQPEEGGPKREAFMSPVSNYINSKGDALFACDDPGNFHARYSGKSTMTFMLLEIFLQALVQINSPAYRFRTAFKDTPRTLKAVVLTTPPSMPDLEREIFRGCAYEALGILWKCLRYDHSAADEFNFIGIKTDPLVPEVVLDWDEAEAAQIVYLYNETQEIFGGNCCRYLKFLRRSDADGRFDERDRNSDGQSCHVARVASLDIGGGTTDMVVTDYSFPKNTQEEAATVKSREVLREGYKVAGDDLLREIIEKTVLSALQRHVDISMSDRGRNFGVKALSAVFGEKGVQDDGEQFSTSRQQATQQIFMKVGYRILSHLERLKQAPCGINDAVLSGCIEDFIKGEEQCSCSECALIHPVSYPLPEKTITKFVDDCFAPYLKDFSILKFELSVDLLALSSEIVAQRSCLASTLSTLAALFNLYRPDLLLLTGRVANVAGIREFFLSRCMIPSDRLVGLSSYSCGSWYPFASDGSAIGDTKTTVAMGAALAYMRRSSQAVRNFRFDLSMPTAASPVRYLGHMDSFSHVTAPFYRFATNNEFNLAKGERAFFDEDGDSMQSIERDNSGNADEAQSREDVHVLPDNLGYRQFSSPNHPASMLYSIEREEDLEELDALKRASQYTFFDAESVDALINDQSYLGDNERQLCLHAQQDFQQALAAIDKNDGFLKYCEKCRNDAHESALTQAKSELASSEPKGLLAALHRRRYEESVTARTLELEQQHEAEISRLIECKRQDMIDECTDNFKACIRNILADNYQRVRKECEAKYLEVKRLVDSSESFTLNLSLDQQENKRPPYPRLAKLWKELGKDKNVKLPKVFRLKLDHAFGSGKDYKAYVKLKLKTVNSGDENYWTDTGRIYSGMAFLGDIKR